MAENEVNKYGIFFEPALWALIILAIGTVLFTARKAPRKLTTGEERISQWFLLNGFFIHALMDGLSIFDGCPSLHVHFRKLDLRYLGDATVDVLSLFELFLMAPLCIAVYYGLVTQKSWYHPLRLIVSTCQVTGTLVFSLSEIYYWNFQHIPVDWNLDFSLHHIIYFWFAFVVGQLIWLVIPTIFIISSFNKLSTSQTSSLEVLSLSQSTSSSIVKNNNLPIQGSIQPSRSHQPSQHRQSRQPHQSSQDYDVSLVHVSMEADEAEEIALDLEHKAKEARRRAKEASLNAAKAAESQRIETIRREKAKLEAAALELEELDALHLAQMEDAALQQQLTRQKKMEILQRQKALEMELQTSNNLYSPSKPAKQMVNRILSPKKETKSVSTLNAHLSPPSPIFRNPGPRSTRSRSRMVSVEPNRSDTDYHSAPIPLPIPPNFGESVENSYASGSSSQCGDDTDSSTDSGGTGEENDVVSLVEPVSVDESLAAQHSYYKDSLMTPMSTTGKTVSRLSSVDSRLWMPKNPNQEILSSSLSSNSTNSSSDQGFQPLQKVTPLHRIVKGPFRASTPGGPMTPSFIVPKNKIRSLDERKPIKFGIDEE